MKTPRILNQLFLGMAVLLTTCAMAAEKVSLNLVNPVSVAGKQLQSGDYALQWDGTGPNVSLNILKGRKVVATTPARLVDLEQSAHTDTITTTNNSDGSRTLSEIRLHGKKYALEIGGETGQTETAKSTK
jgi:hypothetical protein